MGNRGFVGVGGGCDSGLSRWRGGSRGSGVARVHPRQNGKNEIAERGVLRNEKTHGICVRRLVVRNQEGANEDMTSEDMDDGFTSVTRTALPYILLNNNPPKRDET